MDEKKDADAAEEAFLARVRPVAERTGLERGVSAEAAILCSRFFAGGEKNTVRSNPPHAVYDRNRAAFEELVEKGIVTREPFNDHDVWTYRGTATAAAIAAPVQAAGFAALFAD